MCHQRNARLRWNGRSMRVMRRLSLASSLTPSLNGIIVTGPERRPSAVHPSMVFASRRTPALTRSSMSCVCPVRAAWMRGVPLPRSLASRAAPRSIRPPAAVSLPASRVRCGGGSLRSAPALPSTPWSRSGAQVGACPGRGACRSCRPVPRQRPGHVPEAVAADDAQGRATGVIAEIAIGALSQKRLPPGRRPAGDGVHQDWRPLLFPRATPLVAGEGLPPSFSMSLAAS